MSEIKQKYNAYKLIDVNKSYGLITVYLLFSIGY